MLSGSAAPPRPALRRSDIAPYLAGIGLADSAALLRSDWWIEEQPSRHQVFQVFGLVGAGCVLKAARPDDAGGMMGLRQEAEAYRLLRGSGRTQVRDLLPRMLAWDPEAGVLVSERIAGAPHGPLAQGPWDPACQPGLAGFAGSLAALHGLGGPWPASSRISSSAGMPWILRLPKEALPLRSRPPAVEALLQRLHSTPELRIGLAGLAEAWSSTRWIHGDLRGGHLLWTAGACKLVDWETAGPGDPAWDLGCLLAMGLDAWLAESPPGAGWGPPKVSCATALGRLRSGWRLVLQVYPTRGQGPAPCLATTLRMAGARLLQLGCERVWQAGRDLPDAERWVALAQHLLVQPARTAEVLLDAP